MSMSAYSFSTSAWKEAPRSSMRSGAMPRWAKASRSDPQKRLLGELSHDQPTNYNP
jgi:hypothetical protein